MKTQLDLIIFTCVISLGLSVNCFGQRPVTEAEINSYFGQSSWPFKLSIRHKSGTWNGRDPLVIDAIFTNTSKQSVFIDLKKDFQFNGFLDHSRYRLGHHVEWQQGSRVFQRTKEDHTEIPVGGKVVFTLTSSMVGDALMWPEVSVPWSRHRPGFYKFFINYRSPGKTVDFPGQWVGQAVSNELRLRVK
jgi:hypothetical protein